jgi:hypothetical protein
MNSTRKPPAVFLELLAHRERKSAKLIASPTQGDKLFLGKSSHMGFAEDNKMAAAARKNDAAPWKTSRTFRRGFQLCNNCNNHDTQLTS